MNAWLAFAAGCAVAVGASRVKGKKMPTTKAPSPNPQYTPAGLRSDQEIIADLLVENYEMRERLASFDTFIEDVKRVLREQANWNARIQALLDARGR